MSAKINRDMTWGAERGVGGTVSVQEDVTHKLWQAMEAVICPAECSIYSYRPEGDMDPLSSEGKVCSCTVLLRTVASLAFVRVVLSDPPGLWL